MQVLVLTPLKTRVKLSEVGLLPEWIQWLRVQIPNAGVLGSIPGQGIRSHMPHYKILCTATNSGTLK